MIYTKSKFKGKLAFLSNFYPCPHMGRNMTAEHIYQAGKATRPEDVEYIISASSPDDAKKRGREIKIRPDWDKVKLQVMESTLRQKFKDPELRHKLVSVSPEDLVEENWWGDTYWGVCNGIGENQLGKLLLKLREEFIKE